MLLRSRILRITLVVLAVMLFAGYFAFSTFLFSPLEKDYEYDVAALIPREADFYLAKAGLAGDFDPFPRLAVEGELERYEAWRAYSLSPEFADLKRSLDLENLLAQVDANLSQIPFGKSPLDLFGGEDLALAGYLRDGQSLEQADWAVYGRVDWMGKLGVSLLAFPGLIGLESQGLSVSRESDVVSLSGGQLVRPVHVARVRDVVIASSDRSLTAGALALAKAGGDGSLLQSARYYDHIKNVPSRGPDRKEIEVFLDVPKVLAGVGVRGEFPDPRSQFFDTAFLGRLFQLPACKEVIGVLGVDGGLRADLHGELLSEKLTPAQNRMYRARGFERADVLRDAAAYAPADTVFFAFVSLPLEDVLTEALESAEPALRSNLEDALRSTNALGGIEDVIAELDGALRDRFAVIVRQDDYPRERVADANTGELVETGPPNDGAPVFAIAVVLWVTDQEKAERFRDTIGNNGQVFGLKGRKPGEQGYWRNRKRGFETREFWTQFVPGTGAISTLNTSDVMILSNNIEMGAHLAQTHAQTNRLADRPDFGALLNSSLHDANAMVWLNPEAGIPTFEKQARKWANEHIDTSVDWRTIRAEEERKLIPQMFPGKARGQLTPEQQSQLDAAVDPTLRIMATRMRTEQVPTLTAQKLREVNYLKSLAGVLGMLRLDPKNFDLSLRVLLEPDAPQ